MEKLLLKCLVKMSILRGHFIIREILVPGQCHQMSHTGVRRVRQSVKRDNYSIFLILYFRIFQRKLIPKILHQNVLSQREG